jgi:uncharacterized protein (TIGR01619 family)
MNYFAVLFAILVLVIIVTYFLFSKNGQTRINANWDYYLAQYENGSGSVSLNMDLKENSPHSKYQYVVITGVKFKNCNEEGFPIDDEFLLLNKISENVLKEISYLTRCIHAGTFTYQQERLEYIYVKDTSNIEERLTEFYQKHYEEYEYNISIKKDENWDGYLNFLYPNEEIQNYMTNQKIVVQLISNGDDLSQARQVDHWLYFEKIEERTNYEEFAIKEGFKIIEKDNNGISNKSFKLHISRVDYVDIQSISKVTFELRKKALQLNAEYDGWETYIIKE